MHETVPSTGTSTEQAGAQHLGACLPLALGIPFFLKICVMGGGTPVSVWLKRGSRLVKCITVVRGGRLVAELLVWG